MTKEELINFIKYLRSKEKIVVDRIIANGKYEAFCRQNPYREYPVRRLHKFALACKCLPHRDAITKLLHTAYDNFQKPV